MPKPRWELEDAIRRGNELAIVAAEHRDDLEPRLEPGALETLEADLALLREAQERAVGVRRDKEVATLLQNEMLAQGAKLLSLCRNTVRAALPGEKAVQKGFGIGEKVFAKSKFSVCAALARLLTRAREKPEIARAAGLIEADLSAVAAAYDALKDADSKQEALRFEARNLVADRNFAHLRVEAAMHRIAAVAAIVFRDQPDVRDRFRAALPPSRRTAQRRRRKKRLSAAEPQD